MGSGFTHPLPKLNLKSSAAFPYPLSCSTYTKLVPAEKTVSVLWVLHPAVKRVTAEMFRLPLIEEQIRHYICPGSGNKELFPACLSLCFSVLPTISLLASQSSRSHLPCRGGKYENKRDNRDTLCVLMCLYGLHQRWNLLQQLNAALAVGCDGFKRSLCWWIIFRKVQGQSKE